MTRKYTLPLTYAPKIPAVLSGRCTQTIRLERKFRARDLIMFHGWEGKPYRSKWSFRTPYWEVTEALPIWIDIWGLRWESKGGYTFDDGPDPREWDCAWWMDLDNLAELDGIDPPTGKELGRVLLSMHKIPPEGLEAQIIQWRYTEEGL
jgi:hypothetical protein